MRQRTTMRLIPEYGHSDPPRKFEKGEKSVFSANVVWELDFEGLAMVFDP